MRAIPAMSFRAWLLGLVALAVLGLVAAIGDGALRPAHAQDISEFRETLGNYGRWIAHPRWGEVWVPADVGPDWRPYRLGHWDYTEEWGWYWVADEEWGWIAYHYGRWVRDRELGWVWVPGTEWSPAWVRWRRGEQAVGWCAMAPDEVIAETEEDPNVWLFVQPQHIVAPDVAVVLLPPAQHVVYLSQTVVVNQTLVVRGPGAVVVANPGIPPAFIAARIGAPIKPVSIKPYVVAGTVGVIGAVVAAKVIRGVRLRETITPQARLIQPVKVVPAPVAFRVGQPHRLGTDAPAALRRTGLTTITTTTTATPLIGTPKGAPRILPGPGPKPGVTTTTTTTTTSPPGPGPGPGPGPRPSTLKKTTTTTTISPPPPGPGPKPTTLKKTTTTTISTPPKPVIRSAPAPKPVIRAAPPPKPAVVQRPPPAAAAARKCKIVNGKQVCA